MATYTYTTTPAEDAALAHVLAEVNAERAADDPPKGPVTAAEYIDTLLKRTLRDYVRQKLRKDTLDKLSAAEKDAIGLKR